MTEKSGDTTKATLTVRLIRSFEHRNIKHVVLKCVDLGQDVKAFKEYVMSELSSRSDIPLPFKRFQFDAMKIQHKAYGAKSSDPVIVLENDEDLLLKPGKSLENCGVEHETEISCFKMEDYLKYKSNPKLVW